MIAWYFSNNERELGNGDGRPIIVGETHKVTGTPVLCQHGLHGSIKPLDALQYAKGHYLYRVEIGGDIVVGNDKIVGTERTYLQEINAEDILRKFARKVAMINIENIKPYCDSAKYDKILKWLETGAEQHRSAAQSAARTAAWSAARTAAWSASCREMNKILETLITTEEE